ncbi:glycerol-3-phosphate dehydrogenase [Geoalkalibacter ferrihydriticus]|uniref:Glycerol-3-phosphate dehydrogenase n=2 Tax=Geoalkalibacter ferrihydriticus TaxID=392333 RepID=A0A0C2HXH1_9BACT|nr:FAD-dependent oxidoreductase [Geoalkalibacter ferrihydriticus]KIH77462.1 glycerol-3-phosphate dehydrogenase [Geoalkalibacter ferrihydriticus DSM 17813]SDM14059.1 glycerol-3-phosphate dehydrogenase [Geoalkalibacter ferrihydriticus]
MARKDIIRNLQQDTPFDLLVIGGGATGSGIALDAASRGIRTALIEKYDFSEGTSSRSTKLVHGGVRYLEMAIKRLDRTQYNLVKDGLYERGVLLKNAPHLAGRLPLVTPLYSWMEVPYIFAGLKLYDILAGKMGIGRSRIVSRKEALERFPMLKAEGLKAGVLYYDGQFNDARMAVTLITTALRQGAVTANHVEAISLLKEKGRIAGAVVRDNISKQEFTVRARGVINATGPFADSIRRMDEPEAAPILKASSGIHIVLDKRFAPPATGLMIPKTEDGRVLFILPWQGHALIGTTDEPADIVDHPRPKDEEVAYLLRHVRQYFNLEIGPQDIKSTWSGLRPLLDDPQAVDTARLARDHIIQVSKSGLLTMAGGKWTTYRKMAQDAVDHAVKTFALAPEKNCHTDHLPLIGASGFEEKGDLKLSSDFALDADIASHLHRAYGSEALKVAELAQKGLGKRLHPEHPVIEAEVVYVSRHEQAERVSDVLVRRTTLALLDKEAARNAVERTVELMAEELGWDEARCRDERKLCIQLLETAI